MFPVLYDGAGLHVYRTNPPWFPSPFSAESRPRRPDLSRPGFAMGRSLVRQSPGRVVQPRPRIGHAGTTQFRQDKSSDADSPKDSPNRKGTSISRREGPPDL